MKAAEPRRLTYGRASRRGTVAAAAGAIDRSSDNVAAASGGRRAGRGRGTLRKRGLAPSDVHLTVSARRVLPRRVVSGAAAPPLSNPNRIGDHDHVASQPRHENRDAPPTVNRYDWF